MILFSYQKNLEGYRKINVGVWSLIRLDLYSELAIIGLMCQVR